MIHQSSFIDENVKIGSGTKIWHFCHIISGTRIGNNCNIGQNVMIGPDVIIGDNVKIQNNVSLYKGIIVEDDVFIGPSAVFTNVKFPRSYIDQKSNFEKTIIKKGCTIGANSTIICGIELGEYCFVGAGAVVTKSFPDKSILLGNPAKVNKKINLKF
jgi:UDP-2-acetamido-3-amino-2,3-dideoxy-glucuronate N-acetyltransferase